MLKLVKIGQFGHFFKLYHQSFKKSFKKYFGGTLIELSGKILLKIKFVSSAVSKNAIVDEIKALKA